MPSLGSLTLPDDPVWVNEFDWTPVEQSREYSLTGAPIVQVSVKQAGRPIHLDCHWLDRAEVTTIEALADTPGVEYVLTISQGAFNVVFDRPPYEIAPLRPVSDPDAAERYAVILHLLTI